MIPSWIYDDSPIDDPLGRGQAAVDWLRKLKHPKNPARGHPFKLDGWQERIIRRLYGPRNADGTRIVRRVVLLLPRGNRKTAMCAAITLLHLCGPERTPGGLVISAASARDQAKELFKEAALIINHDRRLSGHLRVSDHKSTIKYPKAGTEYSAMSADGGVAHGRTPSVVVVDELHVWRRQHRGLWEALDSSLVKTAGTLMVVATTAGRGQENLAWECVDYAMKVQKGEIDDPATLPIIFAADKDDDWRDEALWRRVNPGMSCTPAYPDIVGFRDKAKKAEHSPADRDGFLQFNMNVWLDQTTTAGFVDMDVYDRGNAPIDVAALAGKPCYIGVDMSATTDLTAVVAAFPDEDGGYTILPHLFCPRDNLRAREDRDGVPYTRWAEDGFLTATPGPVIDYRAVESCIRDLAARFDVREMAFDRAYAQPVMAPLLEDGFPVVTLQLGWVTQSPALNELERAIISETFRHGGHPVLRHHFASVHIQTDAAGNRTMHKGRSACRIDGAFATWMAVSRAAAGNSGQSIYENASAFTDGLLLI